MNLPKSIRVGYRDFAVEEWATNLASTENKLGMCDRDNAVIKVRMDHGRQLTAEVLLHEVLHAAYHMGCLDESANEEKVVNIFGNQLSQIWRDNPEFVTYMSASLTAGKE